MREVVVAVGKGRCVVRRHDSLGSLVGEARRGREAILKVELEKGRHFESVRVDRGCHGRGEEQPYEGRETHGLASKHSRRRGTKLASLRAKIISSRRRGRHLLNEGELGSMGHVRELVHALPRFDVLEIIIERQVLDPLRSRGLEASYARVVARKCDP